MAEQYFEMLWDCTQCDARGLLGQSQRHCPMCGAAQDPTRRYFPRPEQEVKATGHRYVGVDWRCTYCESPNSAAAAFCINCGGPKSGEKAAQIKEDAGALQPIAQDRTPTKALMASAEAPPNWSWFRVFAALVVLGLSVLAYQFFSEHDETVQIVDKTWSRQVQVEQFTAVTASDWCDAMPAGAYQVSRSREQRSSRQIEVGQDCQDRRVDMGDGTFTKRQECTPRYKSEPVYDTKCRYRINRWQLLRTDRLAGDALLAPSWPNPVLAQTLAGGGMPGGEVPGVQRLGSRSETYRIQLQSDKGRSWSCDLSAAVWSSLAQQQTVRLKVRGTGGADCASLGVVP